MMELNRILVLGKVTSLDWLMKPMDRLTETTGEVEAIE